MKPMKKATNANGQTRLVTHVDDKGVYWCIPGKSGEHYSGAAEWEKWLRGER